MYRLKIIKFLSLLLLSTLCFSMLFSCSNVKFKVEFIVDGEVYKTVSTKDKSEIDIPKNPKKEGFDFDGWYLDDGRWNDKFTANSLLDTPISDDMVLKVYAKFIPITEEAENFLFKACDGGYEVIGYTGDNPIVTIPSTYKNQPVLAIGRDNKNEYNFAGNKTIEELIIPDSVTQISNYAFSGCVNLKKLTLPGSITNMGRYAFYGCENITDVTLPAELAAYIPDENLTTVVINAGTRLSGFYGGTGDYKKLISVTIADSVTSIGQGAFLECESLTTIRLPNGLTEIPSSAFNGCKSLTSITIPDGVTSIGDLAFNGCESLNNVIIPESVSSIGKYAFASCSSLTSLTFQNPNGWQVTGGRAIESSMLSDPASAAEYFSHNTWGSTYYRK